MGDRVWGMRVETDIEDEGKGEDGYRVEEWRN